MVHVTVEAVLGTHKVLLPLVSQGRVHLVDIRGDYAIELCVVVV